MSKVIRCLMMTIMLFLFAVFLGCDTESEQASVDQTATAEEFEGYKYIPVKYSQIKFSHTGNFYDQDIFIELTNASDSGTIYYTLDGNDPVDYALTGGYPCSDSEKYTITSSFPSDKATIYTGPILIKAGDTVTATTVKAAIINEDSISPIVVKTYVTGKNVFKRFDDTTLIFVLSSDTFNLEDSVYGVTVPGKVRNTYLECRETGLKNCEELAYEEKCDRNDNEDGNPTENSGYIRRFLNGASAEADWMCPANWHLKGRMSEREMYVEVFDSNGNGLIDQAAGARITGNYSRPTPQKSWRLIARKDYSAGNGKFKYPFFGEVTDAYGNLLEKYDRITLRNNANDRESAAVRDEIIMRLADQAGFPDTQAVRPAAVFLNSEYYGFSWLHEAYNEAYLDDMYGGKEDNYEIVGGKESEVEGEERAVEDYNRMYALAMEGLKDDRRFEEFCSQVDIDNLILYYAIQVYIDNKDWPGNNYKLWKYYAAEDEKIPSTYLDGKWRFLLYDTEYSLSLYRIGYEASSLSDILAENTERFAGASLLLNALFEREDMREKFTNAICDLSYGAFSSENIIAMLDEVSSESQVECMYALNNGYTSKWATEKHFLENRERIREFARNRQGIIFSDILDNFGYENETYEITLKGSRGAAAYLNTRKVDGKESITSSYFINCSVPIATDAENFAYWKINDGIYKKRNLTITRDMVKEGKVGVQLYLY